MSNGDEALAILAKLFSHVDDMGKLDASYFVDNAGDIFQAAKLAEKAMKEKKDLSEDQAGFAAVCVTKWVSIKEDVGQRVTVADPSHSALLMFLLMGGEPLKKAPPKLYSRPSYALGNGEPVELWQEPFEFPGEEYSVVIGQSRAWKWTNKEAGLLEHENGDRYRYDAGTKILQKI